ncbi:MAG: hypothetical protein ACTSXT_13735 [Candidatus Helarchaeota archaeon]
MVKLQRKKIVNENILIAIDLLLKMEVTFEENIKIQKFIDQLDILIKEGSIKRKNLLNKYHGKNTADKKAVFNQKIDQKRFIEEYNIYLDEEIVFQILELKREKVIPQLFKVLKGIVKFIPIK